MLKLVGKSLKEIGHLHSLKVSLIKHLLINVVALTYVHKLFDIPLDIPLSRKWSLIPFPLSVGQT